MSIKNLISTVGMFTRAHSDKICLIGGGIALVGALVTTVKAGMDTTLILDQRKTDVDRIEARYETSEHEPENTELAYSEEDRHHDLTVVNKVAIMKLLKTYALPFGLATISLLLFVYGNKILTDRNTALATALTTTQTAFEGYRNRVRTFLGEEKEAEVFNGLYKTVEKDDDGNEVEVEKYEDDPMRSAHDRVFDESSPFWRDEQFKNRDFLEIAERELNQLLQDRCMGDNGVGIVVLNEVYSRIGCDRTPDGQTLGWIYEANGRKDHIDLGFHEMDKAHRMFLNGLEKSCWLHFNYTGDVISMAKKKGITKID